MLENLKKLEAEKGLGGGDYFKVQNGNNVIRVLTEGVLHEDSYQGRTTVKFVTLIVDRRDGKVKPYFAPYTVYKQIAQLEQDPFYAFNGMPMPYDVNIKVENAGTKEVEYNVQASPQKTDLTAEEVEGARKFGSVADYLKKLKDSKQAEAAPAPSDGDDPFGAPAQPQGKPAPDFLQP